MSGDNDWDFAVADECMVDDPWLQFANLLKGCYRGRPR